MKMRSPHLAILLESAIDLRMYADVPVGVCLSGGLDSSLITAIAARGRPEQVHTFSGVAPGWQGDESKFSRDVSSMHRTEHTEIELIFDDFVAAIPRYVQAQEMPAGGVSPVARMLVLERAGEDVTVLLDGQGGDELLAGYVRFHDIYRRNWPGKTLDVDPRPAKTKSGIATLSEFRNGVLPKPRTLQSHAPDLIRNRR